MAKILAKLTRWADPKLEKYRAPKPEPEPEPYLPETIEDFLWFLKKTPESVLPMEDRARIAAVMAFRERRVREVMTPKSQVTFVHEHDFLGPLMLDKLYKSGQEHFPVLSADGKTVSGVIHTEKLNSLKVEATERAAKYMNSEVYFLREDYTLKEALAAFLRTNSFFFVVVNHRGEMTGLLTFQKLISEIVGEIHDDGFTDDGDARKVAGR